MRYMDIHKGMGGLTAEQLAKAHEADKAIEGQEGVTFLHAWADPGAGTVFCLSEAPNREAVQRVHERAGHRADEIYEVPLEVE